MDHRWSSKGFNKQRLYYVWWHRSVYSCISAPSKYSGPFCHAALSMTSFIMKKCTRHKTSRVSAWVGLRAVGILCTWFSLIRVSGGFPSSWLKMAVTVSLRSNSTACSQLCGLQGLGDHSCESMQGSTEVGIGESGLDASERATAAVSGGSVDASCACWDSSEFGSCDGGSLLTVKLRVLYEWQGV